MAVEKLLPPKFAKIKLRQDALQTTFLIFETFCIPQILAVWEETGVFQQPLPISLIFRLLPNAPDANRIERSRNLSVNAVLASLKLEFEGQRGN